MGDNYVYRDDCYILALENFCDNCPEFDVCVDENEFYHETGDCRVVKHISRIITCSHHKRCVNMMNWLSKRKEQNEDGCITD